VSPWDLGLVLGVLGLDYALKSFASQAGARELDFLLAPTAALVGALTGHDFSAESGAGYTSRELFVVIAPACSGMNFAIIAFTALAVTFVGRLRGALAKMGWVMCSAPVAYVATIVANSLRITLGLGAGRSIAAAGWLSHAEAHRALGILVYLGCLLGLHALASAAFGRRPGSAVVPLATYVGVTVLAPLLHGAFRDPAFFGHAGVILGTAGALAAVLWHLAGSASRSDEPKAFFDGTPRDRQRGKHTAEAQAAARANTVVDPIRGGLDVARRRVERPLPRQGDAALVFGALR
jgi:exosortase K